MTTNKVPLHVQGSISIYNSIDIPDLKLLVAIPALGELPTPLRCNPLDTSQYFLKRLDESVLEVPAPNPG